MKTTENLHDEELLGQAVRLYKEKCKNQIGRVYLIYDLKIEKFRVLLPDEFDDPDKCLYIITKLNKLERRSFSQLMQAAKVGIDNEVKRKKMEKYLSEEVSKILFDKN